MNAPLQSLPEATKAAPSVASLQETAYAFVIAAVVVAIIYFGRPLLVPLALSILLAFALAPVMEFLRRLGLGRIVAVTLSVTFAVLLISGVATFIGTQVAWLATSLPHYQQNIVTKIQSVQGSATQNGLVHGIVTMFDNLSNELSRTPPPEPGQPAQPATPEPKPQPVVITNSTTGAGTILERFVGPVLEPLANLVIIIVFVIFILLQKEDLRDRFIMLAGARDLQRTTLALDDGAERLSRYLLLQTAVNTVFGILVAAGLWIVGVPNPALWGLIAGLFRYVPYIGVPIAALLPVALAIAVDPGWSMMVWTLVIFGGLEAITGQAVEPFLYGRNTGLSAVAVVISASFWTFLWGPVGLLLSTPLTMCLVVLGRHVEQLRFLEVMLGDRPPMAPEESFYLRMLAGNPDEAAEEAVSYLQEHRMAEYFDNVAVRGLALAQLDVNRGALTEEGRKRIASTVEAFIDNLTVHEDPAVRESEVTVEALPEGWDDKPVLCVAGRSVLDHAAASLLAHLLERRGIGARCATTDEVSASAIQRLDGAGTRVVCVSYLEPGSPKNARYLARRLRRRLPGVPLIAGFWSAIEDDTHYLDSFEATECDFLANSLHQAVDQIVILMKRPLTADSAQKFLQQPQEEQVTD